tara:strand:- start:3122 stop:3691 length:570 start_codon:yes stop_codon:yes gene_type:complete
MSYQNNVLTQLSEGISSSASTIKLDVPEAPYKAPLSAGGTLVLADSSGLPTKLEIISYVSASTSGNVITLTGCARGREGTIGRVWTSLDVCYQAVTAGMLNSINSNINGRIENDTGGELKASDLARLGEQVSFGQVDIADIKLEKSGGLLKIGAGIDVPYIKVGGVNITVVSGELVIGSEVKAADYGRT